MSKEETQPEEQGVYAFKLKENDIVRVWCPRGMLYGEHDADPSAIYENTHFATYEEVQRKLVSDSRHELVIFTQEVEAKERDLEKAKAKLADITRAAIKVFNQHGWPQEER